MTDPHESPAAETLSFVDALTENRETLATLADPLNATRSAELEPGGDPGEMFNELSSYVTPRDGAGKPNPRKIERTIITQDADPTALPGDDGEYPTRTQVLRGQLPPVRGKPVRDIMISFTEENIGEDEQGMPVYQPKRINAARVSHAGAAMMQASMNEVTPGFNQNPPAAANQ